MGMDKAQVKVGGQRLLDFSLAELKKLNLEKIVLVSKQDLAPLPEHVLLTSEEPAFGGPVAGIAAGLKPLLHRQVELVAILSVDAPHAPRAIPRLSAALEGAIELALIQDEPLLALWRIETLQRSLQSLNELKGSLRNTSAWSLINQVTAKSIVKPLGDERDYDTFSELSEFQP